MNVELNIGDVVRLKGGSKNMTVVGFSSAEDPRNAMITCAWHTVHGGDLMQDYPYMSLRLVENPSIDERCPTTGEDT